MLLTFQQDRLAAAFLALLPVQMLLDVLLCDGFFVVFFFSSHPPPFGTASHDSLKKKNTTSPHAIQ